MLLQLNMPQFSHCDRALVVSYHKRSKTLESGMVVSSLHVSRPLEKWVWSIPFLFKCTGVLVHCFVI